MIGPAMALTQACAEEKAARTALENHRLDAAKREMELKNALSAARERVALASSGLDLEKIGLARSVLALSGSYTKGGQERDSVVRDAIDWLSTGKSAAYRGLNESNYGTKSYDRWYGQRSDHEWGGPKHGSIIFEVGLRDRKAELTPEQREAALYYLLNIAAIEAAREQVPA